MTDVEKPEKEETEKTEKEEETGDGGDDEKGGDEKEEPGKKRVIVKKWNAVAYWAYNIDNDTCAICTNELMVPCLTTCEANPHLNEECTVAWGQCGHSYHFHCISNWLKKHSTCPLDDEEWDFVQY
eukprot:TRINITY_DN1828_c0_g1_i7.p1 TRINITY_DN1828_c0_g1~~TRINITY_DN1828_c0_g1_i7.p1  ORF type:complete len:126 (+),score=22.66 TRINITY_DN1828_c0_g1_i7:211-588(+)